MSDLIHREKHGRDLSHLAPLAAKRGAPDTGPDPLRTHLEQVAEAKRAGAAVPADIDPETYRTGDWKCVDCGLYLTTHPGGGLYCERCARKSAKPGKGRWKLERRARKHDRRRPPLVQYNLPGQ